MVRVRRRADVGGCLDAAEGLSRIGYCSPDCHCLEGVGFRYGGNFDPLSNLVLSGAWVILVAVSFLYHRFSERLTQAR